MEEQEQTRQDSLTGTIAYKGNVQGEVCIIRTHAEIPHFNEGSILVTEMTDPAYVPIMKKAKAVITDEGGLSCHAAIVSRELNIPCIIGTKNATEVLKDGGQVEVDAERGIVAIIK